MTDSDTEVHVQRFHGWKLPPCFEKREDATWDAVHKLVHDLARKKGEEPHDPFGGVQR